MGWRRSGIRPTATFLYDIAGFLTSWLADLAAEQRARDGRVPNVVPDVLPRRGQNDRHNWHAPTAGWGDAATIVPWVVYARTGDSGLLAQQFESMKAWVEFVRAIVGPTHLWDTGFQYGDWLDPAAPPDRPEQGTTDTSLVATAYYARSAEITADVAAVLGDIEAESRYRSLTDEIRRRFIGLRPSGRHDDQRLADGIRARTPVRTGARPGAAAFAGRAARRARVQERLSGSAPAFSARPSSAMRSASSASTTTAYDCSSSAAALRGSTRSRWARRRSGSAGTACSRWGVNPGQMTSFNHYAFGAIADWLHRTVAGLAAGRSRL